MGFFLFFFWGGERCGTWSHVICLLKSKSQLLAYCCNLTKLENSWRLMWIQFFSLSMRMIKSLDKPGLFVLFNLWILFFCFCFETDMQHWSKGWSWGRWRWKHSWSNRTKLLRCHSQEISSNWTVIRAKFNPKMSKIVSKLGSLSSLTISQL